MANEVDLAKSYEANTEYDDVIIEKLIRDIPGGRSIDVSGLTDTNDVVFAGHAIMKDDATGLKFMAVPTKANGDYKDVAVTGYSICGVLYRTIPKEKPLGSIMTRGVVNKEALVNAGGPNTVDGTNITPIADLPLIEFIKH